MANSSSEERRDEAAKEMVHKTKLIQFLGRTTPIILQNDNGPCPLLAICNVLLLRNNLNLSSDVAEVSQEKLLSLVAERLIDSNSNVNNKDAGYVENQQQNIADAIDLLPRLTTGIDVNIRFRKISDFEFTRECAIFDLLDIPLYHGWIVDPQDSETASAIGVKSYNTLMSELVALETQNLQSESQKNAEEDSVDFVAATTASLGVPSPSLSRGKSFDDSSHSACEAPLKRKGDHEEEDELLRALKMSESEFSTSANDVNAVNTVEESLSVNTNSVNLMKLEHVNVAVTLEENSGAESQKSSLHQPLISKDENVLNNYDKDLITFDTIPGQDTFLPLEAGKGNPDYQLNTDASESDKPDDKDIVDKTSVDTSVEGENTLVALSGSHTPSLDTLVHDSGCDEKIEDQSILTADIHETQDVKSSCDTSDVSRLSLPNAMLESCNGMKEDTDVPEAFIASANGNEPIYEGEECILETASTSYEDREPMYEGEVVLAEQVDRGSSSADGMRPKDGISPREGELIKSFLRNSASQLTIYGLFCLQDGLKERELCVFFRNNHFNTMFKIDGELYLLATDQGYINQTDLVWEKLNEVNGDTLFMTSNFKEFKVENQETSSWDEQNAMANTADYLASMDSSAQANTNFNSDLQLAIALQQQEFEQQPQSQRNAPQSNVSGGSRLVTGPPQPTRPSGAKSSSSRQEQPKSSKEKCVVM